MSMVLVMSALGALALTSGIALAAAQPQDTDDHEHADMTPVTTSWLSGQSFEQRNGRISAVGREPAHAAMREHFERR